MRKKLWPVHVKSTKKQEKDSCKYWEATTIKIQRKCGKNYDKSTKNPRKTGKRFLQVLRSYNTQLIHCMSESKTNINPKIANTQQWLCKAPPSLQNLPSTLTFPSSSIHHLPVSVVWHMQVKAYVIYEHVSERISQNCNCLMWLCKHQLQIYNQQHPVLLLPEVLSTSSYRYTCPFNANTCRNK
jgi:hypothetical protein